MEALKWIGYIVAALLLLSTVVGVFLAVSAAIATVGALAFPAILVALVAAAIREWWQGQ